MAHTKRAKMLNNAARDWAATNMKLTTTSASGSGAGETLYPCADCGTLRTKEEGGTTFTVCDECWEKHYAKYREAKRPNAAAARKALAKIQKLVTPNRDAEKNL
jgi:DNA-directed RNA polymerase subunit RPC12/RpoP